MTYVIGADCIDELDRSCIDVCPVDCIYEGDRKSYIHPGECIDCGACEVECPVSAIVVDRLARTVPEQAVHLDDARVFFTEVLPGRAEPVGTPGGAGRYGAIGVDTPLVAAYDG
ncbi:ferredoxin family protein [Nocardioides sp. L-11A]|uniref:indolepyruvate ferredoxin oxidoreductase subunit alpha n=1 Tax=Nocardioides sp. L-11A TaxID=3043848 RepID=UPI00249C1E7F|nr:ferredoxin family protein [Nocardioides sp. L-11A]